MKRDQIIIFILVGVMAFSAIAFSLPYLSQGDDNSTDNATNDNAQDVINQAAEQSEQIPNDRFTPEGDVEQLLAEDLVEGDGTEVAPGDTITVHYSGWLASDGSIFDSSHLRGEPATFGLSSVIAGWTEGIPGMKVGGLRRLVVPSELAYGESGTPDGSIAPGADLVFEVELLGIE